MGVMGWGYIDGAVVVLQVEPCAVFVFGVLCLVCRAFMEWCVMFSISFSRSMMYPFCFFFKS